MRLLATVATVHGHLVGGGLVAELLADFNGSISHSLLELLQGHSLGLFFSHHCCFFHISIIGQGRDTSGHWSGLIFVACNIVATANKTFAMLAYDQPSSAENRNHCAGGHSVNVVLEENRHFFTLEKSCRCCVVPTL